MNKIVELNQKEIAFIYGGVNTYYTVESNYNTEKNITGSGNSTQENSVDYIEYVAGFTAFVTVFVIFGAVGCAINIFILSRDCRKNKVFPLVPKTSTTTLVAPAFGETAASITSAV